MRRLDDFVDVFAFQNSFWSAVFRNGKHGASDLFGTREVAWEHSPQQRQYGLAECVEDSVGRCSGLLAVGWFDGCRTEYVALEWHAQYRVFSFAFDARPHDAAFFRAIRAAAGDEDKGYFWIETS